MEDLCAEADRRLQSLKDQGIVKRVTWSVGGYGVSPDQGGLRVLINGDPAIHEPEIRLKLEGIGAPFTVARVHLAKPTDPF